MIIYESSPKELISFYNVKVNEAFKYEGFYYLKMKPHEYHVDRSIREYNTVAIEPSISLEYFKPDEQVTPVNLVGVIDYEHNS